MLVLILLSDEYVIEPNIYGTLKCRQGWESCTDCYSYDGVRFDIHVCVFIKCKNYLNDNNSLWCRLKNVIL